MTKTLLRRLFDDLRRPARFSIAMPLRSGIALIFLLSALFPATAQELMPLGDKVRAEAYREGIRTKLTQGCIEGQRKKMVIGIPEDIVLAYCGCMARRGLEHFSMEELLGLALDKEARINDPTLKAAGVSIVKECGDEVKQKMAAQRELKKKEIEAQRERKRQEAAK